MCHSAWVLGAGLFSHTSLEATDIPPTIGVTMAGFHGHGGGVVDGSHGCQDGGGQEFMVR